MSHINTLKNYLVKAQRAILSPLGMPTVLAGIPSYCLHTYADGN